MNGGVNINAMLMPNFSQFLLVFLGSQAKIEAEINKHTSRFIILLGSRISRITVS